jgi:hypothetical protein
MLILLLKQNGQQSLKQDEQQNHSNTFSFATPFARPTRVRARCPLASFLCQEGRS